MSSREQRTRLKNRKWIYEDIVERVPPFRWLPPTLDVVAQLVLVEGLGIAAFFYWQMPINTAIFGSLAILYTVVWSAGCLYIAPSLRRLRDPTNEPEGEVLEVYKDRVLLNRGYELIGGVSFFVFFVVYLFYNPHILQGFLGEGFGNPLLFILIGVLAWDVSYRLGLSFVATLLAANRSIRLSLAARRRRGLQYTAYSEVRTLKFLDSVNLYWGASAILVLPIAASDPLIFYGLLAFLGAILGLSALSLMAMETVPWLPPDVESVLLNERFAYVGVCTKHQPHVTPVIFAYDGKALYFAISVASAKFRIIKENRNVAVLVDMRDRKNPVNNRAVLIRGHAQILGEISPIGILKMFVYGLWLVRVWLRFQTKYPRYTKYYEDRGDELPPVWQIKPFVSRVLVRVDPVKMTYWREASPTPLRV
jgi:hypothetical protein